MKINKKVILVDDDHDVREVVQDVLEGAGYPVVSYSSGRDTLEALKDAKEEYYALITDFKMPGMNGLELIQKIVDQKHTFKLFIIISGYVEQALEVRSTFMGQSLPGKIYFVEKVNFKKVIFDLLDSKVELSDLSQKS